MVTLLAACSSYNSGFECKAGKGINCTSVSKINNMVDSGNFNEGEKNPASKNKIKKEMEANKLFGNNPFSFVCLCYFLLIFHSNYILMKPTSWIVNGVMALAIIVLFVLHFNSNSTPVKSSALAAGGVKVALATHQSFPLPTPNQQVGPGHID